jgi:hypothetical protein
VVVRADLPTTHAVALVLRSSSGGQLPLATVQEPGQGHYEIAATVPSGASTGEWAVVALVGRKALARTTLRITAAPAAGEQDDRAEPVSGTPPLPRTVTTPAAVPLALAATSPSSPDAWPWLAVPAVVVAVGSLVLLRRRAAA